MLYKLMLEHEFKLDAVKFSLVTGHERLYPVAMETLSQVPQVSASCKVGL